MKFRKKPVVIDAVQWQGCPHEFKGGGCQKGPFEDELGVQHLIAEHGISTLEGFMRLTPGDWIITGVKGEKYPCKDEIFKMTYESVEG